LQSDRSMAPLGVAAATPVPRVAADWYPWLALAVLVAVYTFNCMDRFVLVILVEPIKDSLGATDAEMGLLTGFVFAVVYSLAGFPIARFADRGSRRTVIAVSLAVWSAMTVLSGLARGFGTLALARAGIALGEAGCSPPAHSLISDYFPPSRRGTAFAVYALGISFGMWLGFTLGGIINDLYGWRAAFFMLGAPGIVLAALFRTLVREPVRGGQEAAEATRAAVPYKLGEALRLVARNRAYVATVLAIGMLSFAGSGFEIWAPTYLIRTRGLGTGEIGSISGLIEGVAGILGTLATGYLADRLSGGDLRWYLWLPLIGFGCMVPAALLLLYVGGAGLYFYYFVAIMGVSSYTAPMLAVAQTLLPPQLRALGASIMLFAINMLGSGAGVFSVGLMSDWLTPRYGTAGLQHAIALSQIACLFGAGAIFYAARQLKRG
jgi:predicted MFS family arabinose efflux permease